MPDGILVVHKPQGMTSHDVVQVLRRRLGVRRIGHTGTLDPMAEGVLVLLIGSATKSQQLFQSHRKAYDALLRLGTQTDTGDAWGRVLRTAPVPVLIPSRVEAILQNFVGPLTQVPPAFSAVKVEGRPLYWWTRRGIPREANPRTVTIFRLTLLSCGGEGLRCRLECSSGTYVRTLAEMIAERLGTVGHVAALTRSAVGPWTLEQARDVAWLSTASLDELRAALLPLDVMHAGVART